MLTTLRNPGFKTIESDLLEALVKAGVVRPDHIEQPGVKVTKEMILVVSNLIVADKYSPIFVLT